MRNGPLRHRVEVHTPSTTTDAAGQEVNTFEKAADRWASIRSVRGNEGVAGGRVRETTTHIIEFRTVSGLKATGKVYEPVSTTWYEIEDVIDPRHQGVTQICTCKVVR